MMTFSDTKIYIYAKAIDMRKGIDGLCQLLMEEEIKPQTGALYLFANRTGRTLKGLLWDRNGCVS